LRPRDGEGANSGGGGVAFREGVARDVCTTGPVIRERCQRRELPASLVMMLDQKGLLFPEPHADSASRGSEDRSNCQFDAQSERQ
jgi:hypothetical protein